MRLVCCQRITVFSFAVVYRFLSGRCFVLQWFTALELSMLHVRRFVFVIYSYVAIKAEATTLPLPKEDAKAKRHLIVVPWPSTHIYLLTCPLLRWFTALGLVTVLSCGGLPPYICDTRVSVYVRMNEMHM